MNLKTTLPFILLLTCGIARTQTPPAAPVIPPLAPETQKVEANYTLDTGDTISVRVARHEDVSGTFYIPADGLVTLVRMREPVQARGKTCTTLADALTKGLSHELRLRPNQVVVSVASPRIRRVYVRGNGSRSGDFDLKNGWRVSELVSVSGGAPQADRVRARLFNPRRAAPLVLNLNDVLEHTDASPDNVVLLEGDTLTLELPKSKRLYVEGEAPRGVHELDERFGLRRALSQIGFTVSNTTGAIRSAKIIRSKVPGDPASEKVNIPVNLYELMTNPDAPDVPLQDLDTLSVPRSERFIYVAGEVTGGPHTWYMPEDRKTRLLDVMMTSGFTTPSAKLGAVTVIRLKDPDNLDSERTVKTYDYGKYLKNGNPKDNPEIMPKDIVFIPNVKRPDVGSVWTLFGLRNLLKTFVPFVP